MHGSGDDVYFRNVRVGALEHERGCGHGTVGGTVPGDAVAGSSARRPRSGRSRPTWTGRTRPPRRRHVTSTAGDAALSVSPQPAYLANGTYMLSEPLQVAFSKAAWTGPVSGDPVTITFRQHIGATQALRTGSYSKTLTFTCSTTNP